MTLSDRNELRAHILQDGERKGDATVLRLQDSIDFSNHGDTDEVCTVWVKDNDDQIYVGTFTNELQDVNIDSYVDWAQNAIWCTAMATQKGRKLIRSAETQLTSYLFNRNVLKRLVSNNSKGYYWVTDDDDRLIFVQRDKEASTDLNSIGCRVAHYPTWEELRKNKDFINTLMKDAQDYKEYERLGKYQEWVRNGDKELRPNPMDMECTSCDQIVRGVEHEYFVDEYEDDAPKREELPETPQEPSVGDEAIAVCIHAVCDTYRNTLHAMKNNIISSICEYFENGYNIPADLPIAALDKDGGMNVNLHDGIDGVALTENDEQTAMQISFVSGFHSECPSYSHDWDLDDLPIETLLYIYENLAKEK